MNNNLEKQKPIIEYPSEWTYKIIGTNSEAMHKTVKTIMPSEDYTISHSNSSKTNKYISLNISIIVKDEEMRNYLYDKLKSDSNIKMVL